MLFNTFPFLCFTFRAHTIYLVFDFSFIFLNNFNATFCMRCLQGREYEINVNFKNSYTVSYRYCCCWFVFWSTHVWLFNNTFFLESQCVWYWYCCCKCCWSVIICVMQYDIIMYHIFYHTIVLSLAHKVCLHISI